MLTHARLKFREVGVRYLFCAEIDVVIKTVFYGRPERELCVRILLQYSLRQKMGERVALILQRSHW